LTARAGPDKLSDSNDLGQLSSESGAAIFMGGTLQRQKEIRQRRQRKKKMAIHKRRLAKATPSEKAHIVAKIRRLTPGAEVIIATLGLEERK
jgi:hypothetical protein